MVVMAIVMVMVVVEGVMVVVVMVAMVMGWEQCGDGGDGVVVMGWW